MNCIAYFDPNASSNPGKVKGMVTFHQCSTKEGVLVAIKLSNLPPNSTRGIHIHEAGDLSKSCESTCKHFSLDGSMHGSYLYPQHEYHAITEASFRNKFTLIIYFVVSLSHFQIYP